MAAVLVLEVDASDFAFKVYVDEFAVAISTLDPAFVGRDLQPYAGMAQRAFAAVAGNSVCVDDADFGSVRCHVRPFKCGSLVCAVMANAGLAGKRSA